MPSYLLTNSLFKTVEYKIENSDRLNITELSVIGEKSTTIILSDVNYESGLTTPSILTNIIFVLGLVLIGSTLYLSQYSALLQNNLVNAFFFIGSIACALAYLLKPTQVIKYKDSHDNKVIFKLIDDSSKNTATKNFIEDLNQSIDSSKEIEANKINLKKNIELEYDIHNKNVDDLFNLGFIDEVLYNRICNSMHEKLIGKPIKHHSSDNVIYLKP